MNKRAYHARLFIKLGNYQHRLDRNRGLGYNYT